MKRRYANPDGFKFMPSSVGDRYKKRNAMRSVINFERRKKKKKKLAKSPRRLRGTYKEWLGSMHIITLNPSR
jgi:hypothetical protein